MQDGVRVHARRYTRVDAELTVSLQRADADKGWSGTTVNIAQEGLLARTQFPVAMDDDGRRHAVAARRSRQPLALQAKVVRHGGDMVALHFVDVGPFEQAAIAEFVIETRLSERQAARPVALRRPRVGVGEELARQRVRPLARVDDAHPALRRVHRVRAAADRTRA